MNQTDRNAPHFEENKGLGVSCTPAGLSLAGVSLLTVTPIGLAPRPTSELSELMKRAYDHDVDLAALSSGLDVVAKALNGGDLGRAMIAAMHLKLPELSWDNAVRVARSDEALVKFNVDELRDWLGRWTTGGGVKPHNPVRPKPVRPRASSGTAPTQIIGPEVAQAVRSGRAIATSRAPTPMIVAERLAMGEEVVGGGPEDPLADAAALATLAAGALLATRRQPGAGRKARRGWSQVGAIPLGPDEDECEEQLTSDRAHCKLVDTLKGEEEGAICRSAAMKRYAECRLGGVGNITTRLHWWW